MDVHLSDPLHVSPGHEAVSEFSVVIVSGLIPVRYYITLTLITWAILTLSIEFFQSTILSQFLIYQLITVAFCIVLWVSITVYLEKKFLIRSIASWHSV